MAYATAYDFVEQYGYRELSQLLRDEHNLVTETLLKDSLQGNDLSGYSGEEQIAIAAAVSRAEQIFHRQSVFMDSHFAAEYRTPLNANEVNKTPAIECCLALSRAALCDDGDNITDTIKEEREYWRKWLSGIAKGVAELPGVQKASKGNEAVHRTTGRATSAIDWSKY